MNTKTASNSGGGVYLQLRNIAKRFGDFTALEDISLDVFQGEFVCFLGPSGCGKTTLLRIIAGLEWQSEGTIGQDGQDISTLPASQRDFGIVFQSYALFPNLSAARNVAYGLENRRMGKAAVAARVEELLTLVGLPGHGGNYPAQLSGGEQQRVALARALAVSPSLLLLDEPLSALDAKVRARLRHEIKHLHQRLGLTTIMVTHDQEEALTMADRIVVMNHGVIEQVGTPPQVYQQPESPFVANFVGIMNFLPAVADGNDGIRLGDISLRIDEGTPGLAADTPVTVCIRPEDVAIAGENRATHNAFEADVTDLDFLGSFYRASLDAGGTVFEADFSANLVRRTGVERGARISVALPSEHLHVFAGSPRG
jgi:iron(III) transport system ATP-binding protein